MATFDKQLSLAIDTAHYQLEQLSYQRGLWAMIRRLWVRAQLKRLEARIPQ